MRPWHHHILSSTVDKTNPFIIVLVLFVQRRRTNPRKALDSTRRVTRGRRLDTARVDARFVLPRRVRGRYARVRIEREREVVVDVDVDSS